MSVAAGIIETAQALGMDPIDLATIISYETAGTFDPTKSGPTTQWGTHRGLIQFGEPQARQYGVDWNDPIGSQLGADGAIVRYYRQNGWQPGMGILDAYSIVNAGAPGLYNRTDANNGGAPGTVADKVNEQFAPHRANAERLLSGMVGEAVPALAFTPSPPQNGPTNALATMTPEQIEQQNRLNAFAAYQQNRTPIQNDPRNFMTQPTNALASFGFGPGQSPYL